MVSGSRGGRKRDGEDHLLLGLAGQGGVQLLAVQLTADEDEAAFALFIFLPRALVIALDDHVHALHHVTLGIALEGNDALEAKDIRAVGLGDLLDPREEPLGVHLAAAQRD